MTKFDKFVEATIDSVDMEVQIAIDDEVKDLKTVVCFNVLQNKCVNFPYSTHLHIIVLGSETK